MTSLNTKLTNTGLKLTNDNGKDQGHIAYNPEQARPWHVVAAGGDHKRWWASQEAAEFYALALYADRLEMHRVA